MTAPILVGYDVEGDRAAVDFGIAAAQLFGAPLVVGAADADGAGDLLRRLCHELEALDLDAECRPLRGTSPAHALHAAAEELDAGLLVVGRGSPRPGPLAHGSVAQRLLYGAPCPIGVVPPAWHATGPLSTVGVAFADTPQGRQALDAAHAVARRGGATLRVLHAERPHGFEQTYGGGAPLVEATTYSEVGSALYVTAERTVAEATADIADVEVDLDVSIQDAADFVVAASRRVDVLVCGSRGYGPHGAVLLGGVTRRVTAEAACPVIVLARDVEAQLEFA